VSLTELTFDNNKITVLPPELGLLTNLRTLIFGNNDIVDPPPSVLIKGTKAIVSYLFRMYEARGAPREIVLRGKNAVENFHELLNQATQLHSLSLRCKTLEDVPKQVPLLTSLTWLELSVNFIHTLPPSMGDLLQLTHLDISYNELPDIPESLASLRQMDFARMSFNFFSFVPTCVCVFVLRFMYLYLTLALCRFSWGRLRTLYIDNNEIREVEDDIGRLTSLELLNMNNNQVQILVDVCESDSDL
jgi:internalin A